MPAFKSAMLLFGIKMKHIVLIIYLLLSTIIFCVSQVIHGKVVRVADGDTITVLDSTNTQTRIRLHGIDCPEIGQDFGQVAKKHVADLIVGKIVNIEVTDIDRYGRSIG